MPPSEAEILEWVRTDVPLLAEFLEQALGLGGLESLGIEFSDDALMPELIEDYLGGAGIAEVTLAANPEEHFREGRMTSPYDRRLHFGISDEESAALWDWAETHDFPVLKRVAGQGGHGIEVFQASEVERLAEECGVVVGGNEMTGALKRAIY